MSPNQSQVPIDDFKRRRNPALFQASRERPKPILFSSAAQKVGGFFKSAAQGLAKVPLRAGLSLSDATRTFQGKEPLPRFDVPGIGEVASAQREASDVVTREDTALGQAAGLLGVGSQAALDVATLGSVAETAQGIASHLADRRTLGRVAASSGRHIESGKQILENLTPNQIAANGGVNALIKRIQTNISAGLAREGSPLISKAVQGINTANTPTVGLFSNAVNSILSLAPKSSIPFVGTTAAVVGQGFNIPKGQTITTENIPPIFQERLRGGISSLKIHELKDSGATLGEYRRAGQQIFDGLVKNTNKEFAFRVAQTWRGLDQADIGLKLKGRTADEQEVALTHEILHHMFEDIIGFNNTKPANARFFEEAYTRDWNRAMLKRGDFLTKVDEMVDLDPKIQKIKADFERQQRQNLGSGQLDRWPIIAERYAYLGQEAVEKGVEVIPEDLRKYYRGIFKGI